MPDLAHLRDLQSTLGDTLLAFAPELILCATIVLTLLLRLFSAFDAFHRGPLAMVACGIALAFIAMQWSVGTFGGNAFTGLIRLDAWACWFRGFILLATILTLMLSRLSGLPDRDDSGDYVVLLLGAALGLMLMASANHLLMVFLAIEMASLPSYALAGFLKGKPTGSEAALKYVVFGAAAGGIMLYGISLLTASVGTGYLPAVGEAKRTIMVSAGLLMLGVGLAYKLSIVPFHVWLPDVFEGAPAEVGAFLSVASKAGAVALLGRILSMIPNHESIAFILAIAGVVTATFGNLMAYAQTDLKRLLGYSTIAHAGFLLAGLATGNYVCVIIYLVAYLFANMAAFVLPASGVKNVNDLAGLAKASPAMTVAVTIAVASLLGLPPLAGFAGKFLVFEAVYTSKLGWFVFAGLMLNTALGAGYYLKLLRVMILDDGEAESSRAGMVGFALVLAGASLVFGVLWTPLLEMASEAARAL